MHHEHLQVGIVRRFQVVLEVPASLVLIPLDHTTEVPADFPVLRVFREGHRLRGHFFAKLPDPLPHLLLPGLPELVLAFGNGPHLRLVVQRGSRSWVGIRFLLTVQLLSPALFPFEAPSFSWGDPVNPSGT